MVHELLTAGANGLVKGPASPTKPRAHDGALRRKPPRRSRGNAPTPLTEFLACKVDTPLGKAKLFASHAGLVAFRFDSNPAPRGRTPARAKVPALRATLAEPGEDPTDPRARHLHDGQAWLQAYFAGAPLPACPVIDLRGTAFQGLVWQHLRAIPSGTVLHYGELAQRLGSASAARAVGSACGSNPLPLLIPCHRVVTSTGKLGGFSCGLHRKSWLLWHEGYLPRT